MKLIAWQNKSNHNRVTENSGSPYLLQVPVLGGRRWKREEVRVLLPFLPKDQKLGARKEAGYQSALPSSSPTERYLLARSEMTNVTGEP